jgi:hypothetical protein
MLDTLGIETGISVDGLIEASTRLSEILGRPLHSQVALNGGVPKGDRDSIVKMFLPSLPLRKLSIFDWDPKSMKVTLRISWLKKLQKTSTS